MRWKQELNFIIRRLIHRRRAERELEEEIRAHLEMEIERNIAERNGGRKYAWNGRASRIRERRAGQGGQPRNVGARVVRVRLAGPAL